MHHRIPLTAVALSTAAVLGGIAPTAMAADAPVKEARIGLIASSTATCLGMPAKAPLKGIPGLTTFTVKDLSRMRAPEHTKCAEVVKNDPNNPVNALIEKLNAPDGMNGTTVLAGDLSPQFGLVEGALNEPCVKLPAKGVSLQSISLVNIGFQDVPVLSTPQTQQCADQATADEDDALARILDQIPVLSDDDVATN